MKIGRPGSSETRTGPSERGRRDARFGDRKRTRSPGTILCGAGFLLLGLSLSGCFGGTRPSPFNRRAPIRLLVENQNYYDARIYVHADGERRRTGLVTGKTSQTFTLPFRAGGMRVEVDFIAGRGFLTDEVQVWDGEQLELRIPPAGTVGRLAVSRGRDGFF